MLIFFILSYSSPNVAMSWESCAITVMLDEMRTEFSCATSSFWCHWSCMPYPMVYKYSKALVCSSGGAVGGTL